MFVIPGIVAMLVYVYIHPQEISETLQIVSFPMLLAFAGFGFLLDVRVGATRPRPSLLFLLVLAFFAWVVLTIAVSAPDTLVDTMNFLTAAVGVFFLTSLGISTVRGFHAVTISLLAITVLIAGISIHQGLSPRVCILQDERTAAFGEMETAVGRPCTSRAECFDPGGGREYLCEHVGLFKTTSITGRVRYLGIFQDPNELAWAISFALPFIFVWYERRHGRTVRMGDRIIVALVVITSFVCNVMTKSRSGQISLLATVGVYFVRRFGWRGIAFGAALAAPILLFGGRSDDSSTQERLECWSEALSMWSGHPFFGVGARQFGQHHYLTAHNSVLLTLAELGPIGLALWTAVVYAAFKIALQVQSDLAGRPEAADARAAAFATLAGLVGMVSSALFLSIAYHVALWAMIGLAAAIQAMIVRHDPEWRLRWRWRDTVFVIGIDVALVSGIALYLRFKGV
jgi:O-antigen ligase